MEGERGGARKERVRGRERKMEIERGREEGGRKRD